MTQYGGQSRPNSTHRGLSRTATSASAASTPNPPQRPPHIRPFSFPPRMSGGGASPPCIDQPLLDPLTRGENLLQLDDGQEDRQHDGPHDHTHDRDEDRL